MPVTLLDEFRGAAGALLAGHVPELGPLWAVPGPQVPELDGAGATPWLISGGVFNSNGAGAQVPMAGGPSPMPDADYEMSCVVTQYDLGSGVEEAGIAVRWNGTDTFYSLVYSQISTGVDLDVLVAGVGGNLASYAGELTNGQQVSLRLRVTGTSLQPFINGVAQAPVIDATIAGPGAAALIASNGAPTTPTTGLHISQAAIYP